MLKLFTGITGFATLVGTSYSLMKGRAFYISVALSFLLTLMTIIAWHQSDKTNRLKSLIHPLLIVLLKQIGAEVVPIVVETAMRPGMKNEVIKVLTGMLRIKPDSTEQYWIYIMLGKIGGRKSKSVIKKGLSDKDEFIRLGAKDAWELLTNTHNNNNCVSQ